MKISNFAHSTNYFRLGRALEIIQTSVCCVVLCCVVLDQLDFSPEEIWKQMA